MTEKSKRRERLKMLGDIVRGGGKPPVAGSANCSADERLQSLRREGWRDTWMAAVLVNGDDTEIAVVFPNGTYFRGTREYPPNE